MQIIALRPALGFLNTGVQLATGHPMALQNHQNILHICNPHPVLWGPCGPRSD